MWLQTPLCPTQVPQTHKEITGNDAKTQQNTNLSLRPERADSDSSHYESYGEEDDEDYEGEELVKDRAHYIQWSASQPCLRPAPESRLCGYLWRRKWLGQWSKQLFIVRNDALLVRRDKPNCNSSYSH